MHKIKKFAAEHKREIIFAAIYLLIVVFRFSWFYTHETAIVYRDSQDYLAYDPIRALQGSAVNGRAPVYGTILYLIRIIVGEWHQLHAATFLQELVGIAVLPLFSATLRRVGVGTRVRAAVLLLYGFCPAMYGWDNVVLTESLSLSATVVFFFLIVRYIQERRFWDGAGALLVTLWLIFLRPQFLTYLAMLMVFFVWRMFYADKKEKKDLGILLAWGGSCCAGDHCLLRVVFQSVRDILPDRCRTAPGFESVCGPRLLQRFCGRGCPTNRGGRHSRGHRHRRLRSR